MKPEKEGYETLQHVLPACSKNGDRYEARRNFERLCALNACGYQGVERGGRPTTR